MVQYCRSTCHAWPSLVCFPGSLVPIASSASRFLGAVNTLAMHAWRSFLHGAFDRFTFLAASIVHLWRRTTPFGTTSRARILWVNSPKDAFDEKEDNMASDSRYQIITN